MELHDHFFLKELPVLTKTKTKQNSLTSLNKDRPGMVTHACNNPSIMEGDAWGLHVQTLSQKKKKVDIQLTISILIFKNVRIYKLGTSFKFALLHFVIMSLFIWFLPTKPSYLVFLTIYPVIGRCMVDKLKYCLLTKLLEYSLL
jgi:hypothetical protein